MKVTAIPSNVANLLTFNGHCGYIQKATAVVDKRLAKLYKNQPSFSKTYSFYFVLFYWRLAINLFKYFKFFKAIFNMKSTDLILFYIFTNHLNAIDWVWTYCISYSTRFTVIQRQLMWHTLVYIFQFLCRFIFTMDDSYITLRRKILKMETTITRY